MCEKRLRLLTKEQLNNDLLKGRKIYGKVRVGSPCIFCLIIWPFRPLRRRGVEEGLGQHIHSEEKFSSSPLFKDESFFFQRPPLHLLSQEFGVFLVPSAPLSSVKDDPQWPGMSEEERIFLFSPLFLFPLFFLVLPILARTGFVWLSKENQLGCFKKPPGPPSSPFGEKPDGRGCVRVINPTGAVVQ